MEYIEPKPVEVKPHARRNKIIIGSVVGSLSLVALGVGAYFLVDRVFLDFQNIEFYNYAYVTDENGKATASIIVGTNNSITPPKNLRIPRKLGGQPVVEIADDAFAYYPTIETVNFPNTIKVIGATAFQDCINLKSFNVPAALESIGTDAFDNTAWLNNYNDGEVFVGKFLYAYKGEIEEDTILVASEESTLKTEYPDADVINLGNYTHMSNGVFRDQGRIIAVEYPDKFEEINDDSFTGCYAIEKIILPESIKYIGLNAFQGCEALIENPDLSHVEYIADNAFDGSNFHGELTFSDNLKYVGASAFSGNKNLTKVVLNNNLNAIYDHTFYNCTNLAEVVFSEKEYNPTTSHIGSIGAYAFSKTKISYMNVPYNVSSIASKAFADCPNLTGIKLYNNISDTFYISRPYNETTHVFGEWTTSTTSYQGVSVMGTGVFENSSMFNEIVLVDSNGNTSNENMVKIPLTLSSLGGSNSRNFANTSVTNVDLTQNIAETSEAGRPLTTINSSLFEDAQELVSVKLGNGITVSDGKADLGSTIDTIADGAFKNCVKLQSISIPASIKRMDSNVFEGCSALTTVTFETYSSETVNVVPNVTGIKDNSFLDCVELTAIVIPYRITEIGKGSFKGCTKLATVSFVNDKNLALINEGAFEDCSSLVSINIPSSTRTLAAKAFKGCSSLESLTFGVSITSLSSNLINGCTSLATLTLNSKTVVNVASGDIDENGKIKECGLTKVYVPENLVEQYQAHNVWKNYTIEAIPAE